jgi:hypothetical protein
MRLQPKDESDNMASNKRYESHFEISNPCALKRQPTV